MTIPPHLNEAAHRRLMARLLRMSPAEVFRSAVEAGIYTEEGKLTPPYQSAPCSAPADPLYTGAHEPSDP